jgi:hypothetical protein
MWQSSLALERTTYQTTINSEFICRSDHQKYVLGELHWGDAFGREMRSASLSV